MEILTILQCVNPSSCLAGDTCDMSTVLNQSTKNWQNIWYSTFKKTSYSMQSHLKTGQRGRTGKLMSQRGALMHARMPVWDTRTCVKAKRAKSRPGANTRPKVMLAKIMSPMEEQNLYDRWGKGGYRYYTCCDDGGYRCWGEHHTNRDWTTLKIKI